MLHTSSPLGTRGGSSRPWHTCGSKTHPVPMSLQTQPPPPGSLTFDIIQPQCPCWNSFGGVRREVVIDAVAHPAQLPPSRDSLEVAVYKCMSELSCWTAMVPACPKRLCAQESGQALETEKVTLGTILEPTNRTRDFVCAIKLLLAAPLNPHPSYLHSPYACDGEG